MASIVQLKRSSVSGRVPDAANVEVGEPVVNLADQILYTKDGSGTIKVIGAGTTSNIAEGSNLYFTNTRAVSAFTEGSGINIDSNGLISATVTGGLSTWVQKYSNYTATAGDRILANTINGSIVITLPPSPVLGDEIYIGDGYDFSTYSANVARNGKLIEGTAEDLTIDLKGTQVQLVYSNNNNWKLYYTSTFQSDNWVPLTANVTAKVRERFIANTISRPLYVTLPAAPDLGDYIKVADGYDFRSNSVFIVRSAGNKINRVDEDLEIDVRGVSVELVYDGYNNWQVYYTSATGEITTSIARAAISVTGAGSYDNTTGIITITGGVSSVAGATGNVSNAQIQAVFTAGDGISLANGIIALANTIDYGLITGALDATNDYGSIV